MNTKVQYNKYLNNAFVIYKKIQNDKFLNVIIYNINFTVKVTEKLKGNNLKCQCTA